MRALIICLLGCAAGMGAHAASEAEAARWQRHARAVTIVRDTWGIAHTYGKTDADAIFGMIYGQAEDDFGRIERNYLVNLGRLAQVEGEGAIYSDLRQRLFVDPAALQSRYRASPRWLQELMVAWADGLNFYLASHPQVQPKLIRRFEPWMALSFSEGSIGGDIERVALDKLEAFYGGHPVAALAPTRGNTGSNGFAIAPRLTASGHPLLWINPHTSFYFRSELQVTSEQGLDVYGAATWGQLFVYQGFNEHNGWMHPSYGGDAVDEYAETIVMRADGPWYRYGKGLRKVVASRVTVPYVGATGPAQREFTVYRTHHGPVVREADGKWIAIRILQDPVRTLQQSFLRTRTRDYKSFYEVQELRADTSNNTVYADVDGNIAYFHGNFIPKRDARFDYSHPVDGSDPRTEWHGAHELKDTIVLLNPKGGWVANTNNTPFAAAGDDSPRAQDYPAYMSTSGQNYRGVHADRLLRAVHGLTLDGLIALGYDGALPAFDVFLPQLLQAYDALPGDDPRRASLRDAVELLRGWDRRASADSTATTLASFWAQALVDGQGPEVRDADEPATAVVGKATDADRLAALEAAIATLRADFGSWQVAWGEVNRFQRLTDDVRQPFDDSRPSVAVGMGSANWGALASFEWIRPRHTKRLYGSFGNSFVAAVEFGPRISAKAISAGGESGDPASPHFADQVALYSKGQLRDVWFYREDVLAHAERQYHPGE